MRSITGKYINPEDYYNGEHFNDGGDVKRGNQALIKTKNIIVNVIGYPEKVADYLILVDPKRAVWFADSILKDKIQKAFKSYCSTAAKPEITDKEKKEAIEVLRKMDLNFVNQHPDSIEVSYGQKIRLILDWLMNPATPPQNLKQLTFQDAVDKSEEWHSQMTASGGDVDFDEPEENIVIKTYPITPEGTQYYWVHIPKSYCSTEQSRMGHCGRTGGDSLISLRSHKPFTEGKNISDSHVTIAYDKGYFIQAKGKENKKPVEKYQPYIFDLIKTLVTGDMDSFLKEEREKIKEFSDKVSDIIKWIESISTFPYWASASSTEAREFPKGNPLYVVPIAEMNKRIHQLQEAQYKVRNNREWDNFEAKIKEIEDEKAAVREKIRDNFKKLENYREHIKNIEYSIKNHEPLIKYGFKGFGAEYGESEDFGWDDMTKDELSELYSIKPELFSNILLKIILYNKGVITEKPNTKFIYKADCDRMEELIDVDRDIRDDLVEKIICGDAWDITMSDYSRSESEILQYHLDDLNDKNQKLISEKIAEITNIDLEVVLEKGNEYYLSKEYLEDNEDSEEFDFSVIFDAINRSLSEAESDDAYNHYRNGIYDCFAEYGNVISLNDEGVVIEMDIADKLDYSQVRELFSKMGNDYDDLSSIFREALLDGNYFDKPTLSFDDRWSPSADDEVFNERFSEAGFDYRKGGSLLSDTLSLAEVQNHLGRKLHWWDDDVVTIKGIEYKKAYLQPYYKQLKK